MRAYADETASHTALCELLALFPEFRIDALMRALLKEGDRERRLLWLSLLRAYGPEARMLASRMLVASLDNQRPWPWFFVRNLIYLLRRIPPDGELSETEVAAVIQYSRPSQAAQVVKESASYMTDLNVLLGLDVLLHRLALLQRRLGSDPEEAASDHEVEIARDLLSQLLQSEGNKARNMALELTMAQQPWPSLYGPALTQLGELNLQSDPATQERLISLARTLTKAELVDEQSDLQNDDALSYLLTALSGTPTSRCCVYSRRWRPTALDQASPSRHAR